MFKGCNDFFLICEIIMFYLAIIDFRECKSWFWISVANIESLLNQIKQWFGFNRRTSSKLPIAAQIAWQKSQNNDQSGKNDKLIHDESPSKSDNH